MGILTLSGLVVGIGEQKDVEPVDSGVSNMGLCIGFTFLQISVLVEILEKQF